MNLALAQSDLAERRMASPFSALRTLAASVLLVLAFTIPWEDQLLLQGIGTLSRAAGLAALGFAILAVLATAHVHVPRPAHAALFAFVLWGSLSYFWTVQEDATVRAIQTQAQLFAMVWLVLEFAPSRTMQLNLVRAYVLGTYVSAAGTIQSYLSDNSVYWQRHVAAGFDPNDLCIIFAISIPMSFYLMTVDSGILRWMWRLQPLPILAAAMLTASRGGFIAICASLAIIPLLFRQLPFTTKILIPILTVLLVAGLVTYAPTEVFERLLSIPNEIQAQTFGQRGAIWRAGWELFREHPVAGVGLGAFSVGIQHVLGDEAVAHNAFLTVLTETGIIGFSLFCAAMYVSIFPLRRMPQGDRRFWFVTLLVWFLGAMSLSWAQRKATWFLFALLAVYVSRPPGERADRKTS